MSKFAMVLVGALLAALTLSSTSQAKSVSKYCTLLSAHQIGTPLGTSKVRVRSVTVSYPSQNKGDKGRLTLCSHSIPSDTIAESSVSKFTSTSGARNEFAAIVHSEQKVRKVAKTSGPWSDAYYLGKDGFIVLKGKFMFHIEYASGTPWSKNVTESLLAGLATRAVRKL